MITINLMLLFKIICLIMLGLEAIILVTIGFKEKSINKFGLTIIMLMVLLPFSYILIKE